ncbi:DUF2987 domain-containing protein [Photobacterium nomapromontoriensis]|uniref:DUF2987 domain-containing protein n=1 Tax=Photobacterium nomapromontoriensis TaxID=2910237 RepID=UPI003D0F8899
MKLTQWLLAGLVVTTSFYTQEVSAQNIDMRYSVLYSKLKQNEKEGHDDVKIAFFLLDQRDGRVCEIQKGWMQKDEHYEALVIPANNELLVPIDTNLRQANPDVTFVIDDGIICDVSIQVMAKLAYGDQISQRDIQSLVPQMDQTLSDLGGMFSSWFMPDVAGVIVHFDKPISENITLANGINTERQGNKVILKLADLHTGEQINFPYPSVKVTPWIPKAQ